MPSQRQYQCENAFMVQCTTKWFPHWGSKTSISKNQSANLPPFVVIFNEQEPEVSGRMCKHTLPRPHDLGCSTFVSSLKPLWPFLITGVEWDIVHWTSCLVNAMDKSRSKLMFALLFFWPAPKCLIQHSWRFKFCKLNMMRILCLETKLLAALLGVWFILMPCYCPSHQIRSEEHTSELQSPC